MRRFRVATIVALDESNFTTGNPESLINHFAKQLPHTGARRIRAEGRAVVFEGPSIFGPQWDLLALVRSGNLLITTTDTHWLASYSFDITPFVLITAALLFVLETIVLILRGPIIPSLIALLVFALWFWVQMVATQSKFSAWLVKEYRRWRLSMSANA